MAIDIEWQMLPKQSNESVNKPLLYPRIIKNGTVDLQTLCEKIAKHSSYTKGTIKGIIDDMVDIIAELLSKGETISLEEFGTFRLSIGTNANITPDIPYNKRNVIIRGINFQPDKALMEAIGTPKFQTCPRNASATAMSQDQLRHALLEYFKTHDHITRSQFENLYKLKRTTAYVRLKAFVDSGFLIKIGSNRDTKYKSMQ